MCIFSYGSSGDSNFYLITKYAKSMFFVYIIGCVNNQIIFVKGLVKVLVLKSKPCLLNIN